MPIGYKIVEGTITIIEDKAELIRKVYESYVSGTSMKGIAKMLMDSGELNANGKPFWSHGSIGNILSNVKYKGNDFYPAIISEELFAEAQRHRKEQNALLNRNTNYFANAPASNYAFSGKIFCGECGAVFKRYTEHHNKNKKSNWKCKKYIADNRVFCRSGTVDDIQLVNAFTDIINRILNNLEFIRQSPQPANLLQDHGVNQLTQQITESLKSSQIDYQKVKQLILERAALQYKNAKVNDLEYQTGNLQAALEGHSSIQEFDKELFAKTIKSITVYPTGRLKFELMNGIQLDGRYATSAERREANGKNKESSVNHSSQSSL